MRRSTVLFCCIFLALGISIEGNAFEASGFPVLRVLSYNIHHGEGVDRQLDLERIATTILSVEPDVVSLQEVDRETRRTGGVDQAKELARLTNMEVVFGASMDYQGGQYGNAVLTRFPVQDVEVIPLPGEPRSALCVTLQWPGRSEPQGTFRFVATHLDTSAEPRRASVPLINAALESGGELPTILAGDLNALPESPTMVALGAEWEDATGAHGLFTVPVGDPKRQIDYVLYRPQTRWTVLGAEVLDEAVASDHRPILAVLQRVP